MQSQNHAIFESSEHLTLPQMIFKGLGFTYGSIRIGGVSSILHYVFHKKGDPALQLGYLNILIYLVQNNISADDLYSLILTSKNYDIPQSQTETVQGYILRQDNKTLKTAYASFLLIMLDKGLQPSRLYELLYYSYIEELKPVILKVLYLLFTHTTVLSESSVMQHLNTALQEPLARYILALPQGDKRTKMLRFATTAGHPLREYLWKSDSWVWGKDDSSGYLKDLKEAYVKGDYQPPALAATTASESKSQEEKETVTQAPLLEFFKTLASPLKNSFDRHYFHWLSHFIGLKADPAAPTLLRNSAEPDALEVNLLKKFFENEIPARDILQAISLREKIEGADLAANLISARRIKACQNFFILMNNLVDHILEPTPLILQILTTENYNGLILPDLIHHTGNPVILNSYLTLLNALFKNKRLQFPGKFLAYTKQLFGAQAFDQLLVEESKPSATSFTAAILDLKDPKQKQEALKAALDPTHFLYQLLKDKGESLEPLQAEEKKREEAAASVSSTSSMSTSDTMSSSSSMSSKSSSSSSVSVGVGAMTHATTFAASGVEARNGSTAPQLSTSAASAVVSAPSS